MDDAATGKEPAERGRPGPVAEVDLADGRRLVVRAAGRDDLDAVEALYGRLSTDDLRLRFFVGHAPPTGTTMRWLTGCSMQASNCSKRRVYIASIPGK